MRFLKLGRSAIACLFLSSWPRKNLCCKWKMVLPATKLIAQLWEFIGAVLNWANPVLFSTFYVHFGLLNHYIRFRFNCYATRLLQEPYINFCWMPPSRQLWDMKTQSYWTNCGLNCHKVDYFAHFFSLYRAFSNHSVPVFLPEVFQLILSISSQENKELLTSKIICFAWDGFIHGVKVPSFVHCQLVPLEAWW